MFVVFQDAHFLHSICTDLCSLTRWHHRESLFVHVSLRRCCCIFCVCDRCCVERRSIHFSLHLHTIVFNRHSNISQLSLSPIFICFNLHSLRALSLSISLRLCRIGLFLRWSGDIFSHINVWTTPQILQIIYRSETKRGSFTLWPNNVSVNIRCKIINWIIKTGKLSLEIEMVRHYLIRCGEVRWVRKMNGKCLVLLRMWYLRCLVWDWIVVLICVGAEWLR